MASRLKRAWFSRAVVAMAVVAVPLLGAGTAQAAIAGAPPEKTTTRPDLISATILSSNAVDFCFDKSVSNPGAGGGGSFSTFADFRLGGYRSERQVTATSAALELNSSGNNPPFNCVRATFAPSLAGDLSQYTIGTVLSGAVEGQGGNFNQLDDSTPLTGSNTHNGTSGNINGFTAAPDLTQLFVDPTANTISYIEDQNVGTANNPAGGSANGFFFVDSAGNVCYATAGASSISGNTVTVAFSGDKCFTGGFGVGPAIPPTENVSDAVRAGYGLNALTAAADPAATSTEDELPVPSAGSGGLTAKPDLTKTALESDGQAMDFTFDANVSPKTASCFNAGLSTGDQVQGTTTQVIAVSTTSTTIRVTFPNFSTYDEYVVKGIVKDACAAVDNSGGGGRVNTPGSQPAGDNAGAFARGFTTGPDVFSAVVNKSNGVASIALDQRAFNTPNADANQVMLVDLTGNVVGHAEPGGLTFPSQAAGPQTITAQFTQAEAANAVNLAVQNGPQPPSEANSAFTSNLHTGSDGNCLGTDCKDQPNVSQVLQVTTTSALARQAHLANAAARNRAAVRRGQASLRARLRHLNAVHRARLARLRHLAAKHH